MNLFAKFSAVAVLGLACVACSNKQTSPSPPVEPAPPPASAIPMTAAATGQEGASVSAAPAAGPSFDDLIRRPGFVRAFEAMDGAAALPAWVKTGGASTPSAKVQVDGKTMWLAHACEAAGCQTSQLFLLADPAAHALQGLLVEVSGTTGASVQKLVWLGKPDAAVQAFLKDRIAHD